MKSNWYKFIGENLAGGHKLKDFTKGKEYCFRTISGITWAISDTGENIDISNNSKREFFVRKQFVC